jgi:hypothetical protein
LGLRISRLGTKGEGSGFKEMMGGESGSEEAVVRAFCSSASNVVLFYIFKKFLKIIN